MPTDLDRIQGSWHVTALESDGAAVPRPAFDRAHLAVKGKAFTSKGMGAVYTGTIELKSSTKPKSLDLIFASGPQKGTRNLGIYTLERDRWVICLATRGTKRPGKFATKPETGLALETLERGAPPKQAKLKAEPAPKTAPAKPAKGVAARAAKEPAAKAPAAPSTPPSPIEGEWMMISGVFDGKPLAENMVAWCKRITRGDVTTVMAGPQTMLKARFTLNASAHPGAIDYMNLDGTHKGKPQAGIYDLSYGILRICVSAPGQPRPDVFVSKPGDGRSFTTWRLG
jgi:uncharacterized protein (TIGR03067 family)